MAQNEYSSLGPEFTHLVLDSFFTLLGRTAHWNGTIDGYTLRAEPAGQADVHAWGHSLHENSSAVLEASFQVPGRMHQTRMAAEPSMTGFTVEQHNCPPLHISETRGYDCVDFPGVPQGDSRYGDADLIEPLETKGFKYSFIYTFNFIKLFLLIKHKMNWKHSTLLEFTVYLKKETWKNIYRSENMLM